MAITGGVPHRGGSSMTYRTDPTAPERERERLLERIRERESSWTDVFWREVASGRGIAPPRELGELGLDALVARADELDRLESAAAEILRAWAVRTPPPRTSTSIDLDAIDAWRERPEVLGGASLVAHRFVPAFGAGRWAAELAFASRDAIDRHPIDRAHVDCRFALSSTRQGAWIEVTLVMGAPRGAGALRLRPETLLDDLGRMVGLTRKVWVGADEFDGVFHIDAEPGVPRALLDRATQRDLLRLGAAHAPRLALRDGAAELRIAFEVGSDDVGPREAASMSAAVAVVARLATAPVRPLRTR